MIPFPMLLLIHGTPPKPKNVVVTCTIPSGLDIHDTQTTWEDVKGWLSKAADEQSYHGQIPILGYRLIVNDATGTLFRGVGTPATTVNGVPYFLYITHDFFKGDQYLEIVNNMTMRPYRPGIGLIYRDGVPLKIDNQDMMQSLDADPGYPDDIPVIAGNGPIEWINRGGVSGTVVGG